MKAIPLSKTAWVSGTKPLGYMLRVNAQDPDAYVFALMGMKMFASYREAQDAANAIKGFVRLQRDRRYEAARQMRVKKLLKKPERYARADGVW